MPNYSDRKTDQELARLERRLNRQYNQAGNELADKLNDYYSGWDEVVNGKTVHHKGLAERYDEEFQAYREGKYTKEEFEAWYRAQIGRGERWAEMREQMTDRMVNANEVAASYVNDKTPGIYTLNHNYSLYQIEGASNVSFSLLDENTIKRLMEEKNHVNFKVMKVDRKRDYAWNQKRINNALNQGILQGESPYKIADRFLEVMGANKKAAIRNARTAFTSAQNGGRMDSYEKAAAMGIEIEKEWIATSDSRTRESHLNADGQKKPWDSPFELDYGEMMYPGDPAGHPAEVYNCRCTVAAVLPEKSESSGEGYKDWVEEKSLEQKQEQRLPVTSEFTPAKTIQEAEEFVSQYVDKSGWGGLGVSYKGIHVDVANEINKAIHNVHSNFDVEKLYGVFSPTKNSKLGKLVDGAKAGYMPVRNSIVLNRQTMKNMKTAVQSVIDDSSVIRRYIENPDKFDLSRVSSRVANVMRNSVISGRGTVPESVEEMIYHELGHSLEKQIYKNDLFSEVEKAMDDYAVKVSGYATDSKSEYIAESFVLYMRGEQIEPTLQSVFDGMRK